MFRNVIRFWGGRAGKQTNVDIFARADAARDSRRYREAAILYEQALQIGPDNPSIHIQCGHMFKESGNFEKAEHHYLEASRRLPNDADLALQLGHFYKVSGRLREAEIAYNRALDLSPDWSAPAIEISDLYRKGWRGRPEDSSGKGSAPASLTSQASLLIPDIAPRQLHELLHENGDSIQIRRIGRAERSPWGMRQTLRGVESIRGVCLSSIPITEIQIALNGQVVARDGVENHVQRNEKVNPNLRRYVFNVWHDFSVFSRGRHEVEIRCLDANRGIRFHREQVVIADPLSVEEFPDSDALVPLPALDDGRSVAEQVNARPSMVRPAVRQFFSKPPENILIVRTDQLGDVVISIPALRRLREFLPNARLVGLLTSANVDFASTLNVFDEIVVAEFPDDSLQKRRVMPLDVQEELRKKLESYQFDVAIDLAPSGESRPMLLLSGAPFMFGFGDRDWPWLSAGMDFNTHDRLDRLDNMTASTKTLAFVEAFGALLKNHAKVIRRPELTREHLAPFGISESDRYAILHAGARVFFSRWPHYCELAEKILEGTDLKVIMMTEAGAAHPQIGSKLLNSDRFQILNRKLPFDEFDALLSFCSVFVGNDSGPKHLASLRGVNVVSLHTARINWAEWGQEMVGSIISRRVPCAGCTIYHDPEDCGKGYACIVNITADEVFEASKALLDANP